jgi:hypothetical protein
MKSNDFVKKIVIENHLARDHEVEMAKTQLYFAAKAAIELHGVLKHITEEEGLEGWVQSKITKAADYLQAVHDYLLYQEKVENPPPEFDFNVAESMMQHVLEDAGGVGAGSFAIAIPNRGGSVNGFANGGPGTISRNKKKKVREAAPPAANVSAPAGGTTTTAPAPAAGTTPPAPGQPPKPGAPAPAGAAPAPGQPAKPGAPAGTATPPNPAQVKKDTDALTAVLNNPAHPVNAELQALIKKAASVPH